MYEAYMKNVKDDATGQWTTCLPYKTRGKLTHRPVFGMLA